MASELIFYPAVFIGLFTTIFFLITFFADFNRPQRDPTLRPKVTVCVPCWNDADTIGRTIQSLLELDYPKDKLEIIVVENNKSTDGTYEEAKKYEKFGVKVFSIKEGGKGRAMNFAITKATGEIFGGLDSDSYVTPDALKKMVELFADPKVMAVTPTLKVYQPKTIWQHVQAVEYLYGIFLKKVFALLDSVYVTPGPFSMYRKEFFDKFGGYEHNNITEDIEVSLRIQSQHYRIENAMDANVYTSSPQKFFPLLRQRVRWQLGLIENLPRHKNLFSLEYGALGLFVLPLAVYSIVFVISAFSYTLYELIHSSLQQFAAAVAVNFDLLGLIKISDSHTFYLLPNIISALNIMLILMSLVFLYIAAKYSHENTKILFSYPFYYVLYFSVYAIWWLATLWQKLFGKELRFGGVVWRNSWRNALFNKS